ncbi:MAG: SIMPL domain-containing protein [bacterium]|nr:SIMPL domain-containing protein [bacterium]
MKKLTIMLIFFVSLNLYAQGQQTEKPTLNVTGSARVSIKPDLGILNISVLEVRPKMSDAIKALGEKSNYYNELLKQIGFKEKDIKTTSFVVTKNKVYRESEIKDSGFVASQNIRLEFEYNQKILQKIVGDISKSEKPIDFSFDFELSEDLKKKVQSQIIEIAIKDANEKAATMTKAAKLKLISIKNIAYGNFGGNNGMELLERHQKYAAAYSDGGDMPSFNFTPSDIIFRDTVAIEWLIE